MAATEIPLEVNYQIGLNAGATSTGVKVANVGLGKLSVARFTTQSAYELAHLLYPLFDKSVYREEMTRKSQVART